MQTGDEGEIARRDDMHAHFVCLTDPDSALANRGCAYAFKRDLDRAIADYDEAIRIDPAFDTYLVFAAIDGDAWLDHGGRRIIRRGIPYGQ